MNVVKVMGGLGNQLFQYAFSKYLEKYGPVGLDIDFYTSEDNHTEDIPPREFLLDRFDIDFTITDEKHDIVNEEDFTDQEYHDKYFWGYWQDTEYSRELYLPLKIKDEYITDEVREIEEEITKKSFYNVGIHVRRGDYVKLGWALDMDYYKRAMDFNKEKLHNPRFYVFTDDVEYCEEHFPDCHIISIGPIEDFYLFSKCNYKIIANSTFSFWAAAYGVGRAIIQPIDWKYTDNPPRLYGRFM